MAVAPKESGSFVHDFWEELRKEYGDKCREIIKDKDQGMGGHRSHIRMIVKC